LCRWIRFLESIHLIEADPDHVAGIVYGLFGDIRLSRQGGKDGLLFNG
jgi:hypothetical protein